MRDPVLETLDDRSDAEPSAPREAFAPGTAIGHFRIVRELGAGGMGLVFEAYDPDLDRRVAIKVVRGREASSAAGARLTREAQAMARLAHPNVVGVHEVGTIDGQVFVVMELVRGDTLATWLDHPRPWRDVVDAFVQAGEGLVAAHHAGLVHRDFKPSNVLVDQHGRARVTDFGLAFADDEPGLALGSDLVGTPAFMAPEQRAGEPVDARADQYSFAMSLQDALGAKHSTSTGPRRVRAAIVRALSIDPDARFPTLDAMLVELRAALRTRRRAAIAVAVVVSAAVATSITLVARRGGTADSCDDGARLVDEVWDPAARGSLVERFTRIRPGATVAIASTTRVLDDWASAWKLGRRTACSADDAQRGPRLACLDQGLHELRQQLVVWRGADAAAVDRSVAAATALPGPESCIRATGAVPIDPLAGEKIAAIHALERAGKSRDAKPAVDSLLPVVEGGSPATLAAALFAAGKIAHANGELEQARAYLTRAASEAGRAGDDAKLVESLLLQATVVIDQGRPLDSLGLLDAANAIVAKVGIDRPERLAIVRGDALSSAGRVQEGLVELRRAVELLEARAARDPSARLALARGLGALAGAHNHLHEYETGSTLLLRALAIEEAALGPDHPEVGKTLHDLATHEGRLGRHDSATARLERARGIFVRAYGEHHALVGGADISLAGDAILQGKYDAGRKYFERALAILARVLPADHLHLAIVESGLGTIAREQDRCADAIPHFERALAISERAGAGGPDLATQLVNLGACLAEVGRREEAATGGSRRFEDARKLVERSLALLDEARVAEKDKAEQRMVLADLEHHAGHRDRAIALGNKVLATTTDADGPAFQQLRVFVKQQLAVWSR